MIWLLVACGRPEPAFDLAYALQQGDEVRTCLTRDGCPEALVGRFPGPSMVARGHLSVANDGVGIWRDGVLKPLVSASNVRAPTVSPNHTVLLRARIDGIEGLWRLDLNQGSRHVVAGTPQGDFDGDERLRGDIAFASSRDGNAEIYVQSSGTDIRVTSDPADDMTPRWSPDGSRLAFLSNTTGPMRVHLWDGNRTLLADGDDIAHLDHVWSPDGSAIAVVALRRGEEPHLRVLGLDGSTTVWDPDGVVQTPAWSPDGRHVAAAVGDDIQVWTVGGEAVTVVDPEEGSAWLPRFLTP